MAEVVKCYYCGEFFDKKAEDWMQVPEHARRYAHKKCYHNALIEEESQKELIEYIKNLFSYETLPEAVERQLIDYIENKKYTYYGMLQAIKYHYEIRRGDPEKAYGRIGIIPFVYEESQKYYKMLEEAQERNRKHIIDNNINIPVREVTIQTPKREKMVEKKKSFSFLEGGENN